MFISFNLMLACLTVLRMLCFAIAALFVLLGVRSVFDEQITIGLGQIAVSALVFLLTGLACGWLRGVLSRRAKGE